MTRTLLLSLAAAAVAGIAASPATAKPRIHHGSNVGISVGHGSSYGYGSPYGHGSSYGYGSSYGHGYVAPFRYSSYGSHSPYPSYYGSSYRSYNNGWRHQRRHQRRHHRSRH